MNKDKVNKLINNTIVVLGNDVNSFLTSYSLKTRFPNKEIHHLIIKNSKSKILSDNVCLTNDWIQQFNFEHNFKNFSTHTISGFYDKNEKNYKNEIQTINVNRDDFIKIIKNKCLDIGVKIEEGYIKDYQYINGSMDSDYINLFNDWSFVYIQFDNLKEIKNIHAGFYIDCLGEKSFFFDDDYFDRETHTANSINVNYKFKHYSKLLPNNMMLSGYYEEKSDSIKSSCEALSEGILYRSWDGKKCYIRYYFNEEYVTKHIVTDKLKKQFDLKNINIHRNINCIREKNTYYNVFAMGDTIGNLENVICNNELITQKLLNHFVELFKHKHISVFSKNQWSKFVNEVFEEYANLISLHYALTTRDDSRYWQDRMNQNYKIKFDKLKNFNLKPMMEYFNR